MPKPTGFNVVLAATNLNPSIFSLLWLTKQKIFSEADIQAEGSIFAPFTVNVVASGLNLTVIPDRLQLGFPSAGKDDEVALKIQRVVGRIASELPHTPFQAVGFNMGWVLIPLNQKELDSWERQSFLAERNPLAKFFKEKNSHFGCYLSKDFKMGRLKLDIKPVTLVDATKSLQAAFNYHLDLTVDEPVKQIHDFLALWDVAYTQANEMVTELGKGWSQ